MTSLKRSVCEKEEWKKVMQDYQTRQARQNALGYLALFTVLGAIMSVSSGCALVSEGTEVVAKVGIYGVNERQESQAMGRPAPPICKVWPFLEKCQSIVMEAKAS